MSERDQGTNGETPAECRSARPADAEILAEMRWAMRIEGGEEAAQDRPRFLRDCAAYYERTLEPGLQSHWVATIDDQVVGTLTLHRVEMVPRPCRFDDRFGCITNLYVCPDHRAQGIGRALLRHVIAAAAAEELELLIVWPSEPAIPFYARSGFQWDNEVMELRLRDYVPIRAPSE